MCIRVVCRSNHDERAQAYFVSSPSSVLLPPMLSLFLVATDQQLRSPGEVRKGRKKHNEVGEGGDQRRENGLFPETETSQPCVSLAPLSSF